MTYGPYETAPELVARYPNLVDLMFRNQPDVRAYRVYGARTIADAYGNPAASAGGNSGVGGAGPTSFLEVQRGGTFRSPSVIRRGWGRIQESIRNMARALYDPDDYVNPANNLAPDQEFSYLRVQENSVVVGGWRTVLGPVNTGNPVLGPIYILPRDEFFHTANPSFTFQSLAPANTGAVAGQPSVLNIDGQNPNPLVLVLPRNSQEFRIRNLEAAGGSNLLISLGLGQDFAEIPPQLRLEVNDGNIKHIILASPENTGAAASAVSFAGYVSIKSGGV